MYEDDDRWPDLTTSSGSTWRYEGNSAGTANSRRGHGVARQNMRPAPDTSKPLPLEPPNAAHLKPERSPYTEVDSFPRQDSRPVTVFPGASYFGDRESVLKTEDTKTSLHTFDQSQSSSSNNNSSDMYSQLAALRVPFRRRYAARLPSEVDEYGEKSPLLQTSESTGSITAQKNHVPFDPIDPYHYSGQPKKKVLYGPGGYLGKDKDWKQSNLQRVTEKMGSLSKRVVCSLPSIRVYG